MARQVKPLSAKQVKNAKPSEKQYKLFDGRGLFLLVKPSGSKGWRFKYRFNGKEKLISFGDYEIVSLADAREKRGHALKQLEKGIDPSLAKKIKKQTQKERHDNTFQKVALEWHDNQTKLAETTKQFNMRRFKRDIFPPIGPIPISELTPRMILEGVLRPMEKRGVNEMTHRTKGIISRVFCYGVSCGYVERDITSGLSSALNPIIKNHHPAFTKPEDVGRLLRAIDGYDGSFVVKYALKLAPLFFLRPGELRHAEWSEFDFENAIWDIPAEKMKTNTPHIVPLAKQALSIVDELRQISERSRYLFPSHRSNDRPMSNNALNAGLRRMGYDKDEVTAHGFRATARTMLDEILEFRVDLIEHQLAHTVRDPLGRAYNRTTHLPKRKIMMQEWADYLDRLRKP